MADPTTKSKPHSKRRLVFFTEADEDAAQTGLTFTDILFGFVLQELFVRLASWSEQPSAVDEQLIVGSVLVLGSWIGYRRSRKRSTYAPKFFNWPLVMLALDQVMIVFYFRVATLTPHPFTGPLMHPGHLASETTWAILIVFGLYVLWDVAGIFMSYSKKYPNSTRDWWRVSITVGCAVAAIALHVVPSFSGAVSKHTVAPSTTHVAASAGTAELVLVLSALLLVVYRWLKEIEGSWSKAGKARSQPDAPTAPAPA